MRGSIPYCQILYMGVQNITTVSSFIEFHAVAFASSINICTDYTPLRLLFNTKNVCHTLIRRSVRRFLNLRCSGCTISWHVTSQTRPGVQLPQYRTQPAFKSDIICVTTPQTCKLVVPKSLEAEIMRIMQANIIREVTHGQIDTWSNQANVEIYLQIQQAENMHTDTIVHR